MNNGNNEMYKIYNDTVNITVGIYRKQLLL